MEASEVAGVGDGGDDAPESAADAESQTEFDTSKERADMDERVDARSTLGRLERAALRLDPAATPAFSMVQLEGKAPARREV